MTCLRGVIAAMACALAAAACGSRPPAERPKETVRMLAGGPIAHDFILEFQKATPGASVTMEDGRGSEFVVTALQHGIADAGFAQADTVYAAYRLGLSGKSGELSQLRGIAVGETANVYIVVLRDSPVRQIADLKGHRIGVLPSTAHGIVYEQMILAAYGIDPRTSALSQYAPAEMLKHLKDRSIDAATFGGPRIAEPVVEFSRTTGVRLLEIRGEPVARLRARYPYFNPVTVTPADLPGQTGNVQTLGVDSVFVCREDLSEERAYELTRAYFDASTRVAAQNPGAAASNPDFAAATPVPLHPGAARYYREREVLQ